MERLEQVWKWRRHKRGDFVQSHLVGSGGLMVIRIVIALYAVAMWVYGVMNDGEAKFFIYYTDLNYTILCIYFVIISLVSLHFHLLVDDKEKFIKQEANHFHRFIWTLFEFVYTNAIFLDTVFWALLYNGGPDVWTVSAHAINILLVGVEFIFNKLTFAAIHVLIIISFGLAYVFFAWIYHAVTKIWIYDFLSWDSAESAVISYIGIFLGGVIYFYILLGLQRLRDKLVEISQKRKRSSSMELEEGTNKNSSSAAHPSNTPRENSAANGKQNEKEKSESGSKSEEGSDEKRSESDSSSHEKPTNPKNKEESSDQSEPESKSESESTASSKSN